MSLAKVTEEWVPLQIKVFTRWVNGQLKGVIDHDLDDITKDLASGVNLVQLAQVLTQKEVPRWNKDPKRGVFMVQNCDIAIDTFKKDGIQLVGISGKDVNDCNVKLILGLIWTLILNYSIGKSIDTSAKDDSNNKSSRNALLQWAIERTAGYNNVNNFQPYDLSMCALLDSYVPQKVNYNSLNPSDIENNAKRGTDVMNELGIPVYIYPDDVVKSGNKVDEKTLLTQLAAAKVVLDNLPPPVQERAFDLEAEEAARQAREREEAERLAREKEEAERLAREKEEAERLANAGNDQLLSLIQQLRRDLDDVKNQLDNSNERIDKLENENDQLRKGLSCLKYEVKKLKDAHRVPHDAVAYAAGEQSDNQNQGQPAWVINEEGSVPQRLGADNDVIQQRLVIDNGADVSQLRGDLDQAKNIANSLQAENEQLRRDIQKVENELQNLNSQIQSLPNNSNQIPDDLMAKVNQASSDANHKFEQLENNNNTINEALTCLKHEVKKLKEDNERLNNTVASVAAAAPVAERADPVAERAAPLQEVIDGQQPWVVSERVVEIQPQAESSNEALQQENARLRHELSCLKYEVKKLKRLHATNQ